MARHSIRILVALTAALLVTAPLQAGVTFVINNVDPPGVGFNDPTPASPVGGNPGTTLGEQRLIAFQFGADIWGSTLDSSVDVVIQGTFLPLFCAPTSATLGAAGTIQIFTNFPGIAFPFHWHHSSLANKLAGFDLTPGPPDPGLLVPPFNDDIIAFFNSSIDSDPTCLGGQSWYYGLDNNPPPGTIDFLNVIVHEYAHGLGFSEFIDADTGEGPLGLPDIYTVYMHDNTQNLNWNFMTGAERLASQVNTGNLAWDGPNVTAQVPSFLGPIPILDITSPALGSFNVQAASFGPAIPAGGLSGTVVLVDDGVGAGTDACEAITNNVSGSIALIDRGSCGFTTKVANAQAAGAIAAIVANNVAGGPAPMGGSDPSINIPSVGITLDDGNTLKAALPAQVTLGFDPNNLAGADANGRALLFAPDPVQPGSSTSHFDTSASPNLLMEPAITSTLAASQSTDLTPYLMADIGWMLNDTDGDGLPDIEDACPASNTAATVVIDGCDSGVTNALLVDGCTISDLIEQCASGAGNHGAFVSCVSGTANDLKKQGILSGRDKGAITSCAAGSNLP